MEQEPPDKFDGIERHQSLTVAMGIVFPPKGHPPLLQCQQAPIRDRHTMRITREILENVFWASEGRSDFNYPSSSTQFAKETIESFRPFERLELA